MKNLGNFLKKLYSNNLKIQELQTNRYNHLIEWHQKSFGKANLYSFSTPGRTEIGGNHTDHNHGRVLAGSINLDSIAVVCKVEESRVRLYSEGFDELFEVNLNLLETDVNERETTTALIRGIASRLNEMGYKIGGFDACMTSEVLPGSGLSSSASVEVLIGSIFNKLYNNDKIDAVEIAKIGQYAENHYFGKPCGLMDQIACASGGVVGIDFNDPANPIVEQVDFPLEKFGYSLVIVNTGGSHADLTDDYASVPAEMKKIAGYFGKEVCREITFEDVIENMSKLQAKYGDRAVLRSIHFLNENDRVTKLIQSIKSEDIDAFLKFVQDSGDSSFKFLQNVFTTKAPEEQRVSLALALTEDFINKRNAGACRVHGGGFAGTIQVFLPKDEVNEYQKHMKNIFGDDQVLTLNIRSIGMASTPLF